MSGLNTRLLKDSTSIANDSSKSQCYPSPLCSSLKEGSFADCFPVQLLKLTVMTVNPSLLLKLTHIHNLRAWIGAIIIIKRMMAGAGGDWYQLGASREMLLYLIMALLISFSIDRSLRSQALHTKLLTVKRAEFEVSLILYDKLLMMLYRSLK